MTGFPSTTIYGAKAPWPFLKGLIRDNRPVWFFEETGLPYERVALDPVKGENRADGYARLNPFHKVPTLVQGDRVIRQSAAILHYLASSTGLLYPLSETERLKHLEWLFYCMSDVEAHAVQLVTLLPMTDPKDQEHARWMLQRAEKLLGRALDYLEGELDGKTYLMGPEFYAADILLGCCLYPIRDHQLVTERPRLQKLAASYFARPAFQRMMEINGT